MTLAARVPRRSVTRAGALVLAVLAATLVLSPVSASADDLPRGTTLRPAEIVRGKNTRLLHVEGRVIVDGGRRIHVEEGAYVRLLGRVGDGYLVQAIQSDFLGWSLLRVGRDGDVVDLRGGGDVPLAIASDDGGHVALVRNGPHRTRLTVVDSASGAVLRDRWFSGYVQVMDYGPRRLVLTEWPGPRSRTFWWDPHGDRQVRISNRPALVADVSADRISLSLPGPSDCMRVGRLTAPRTTLWRSCRDHVMAFSPNGGRMVTSPHSDDHLPPVVQVRGERGGLRATYRARAIGFVVWENNRSVLIEALGTRNTAVVRCTPAEACARVTRLHRNPGHPQRLDWSFAGTDAGLRT
jgi:hypothetical protein